MKNNIVFIGAMDTRIQVIEKTIVKSTTGAPIETDVVIATVWAERKTASSSEVLDVKVVAMNVVEYRTHWHPDIAAKNIQNLYIKEYGVEYDVHGFDPEGRKKYLKFKCQRRE